MKINGDLKVIGKADICLPRINYKAVDKKEDGKIFLNKSGTLCYNKNGVILKLANLEDIDFSKLFGKLITSGKELNPSIINEKSADLFSVKNGDTLLEVLLYLIEEIKKVKADTLDPLIEKSGLSIEEPYLKFDGEKLSAANIRLPDGELNIHGEGVVFKEGSTLKTKAPYLCIESNEKKSFHIIKHNLNKRYCWIQIMDSNHKLLNPSAYEVTFSEENRLSVRLNTESPIVVLVS